MCNCGKERDGIKVTDGSIPAARALTERGDRRCSAARSHRETGSGADIPMPFRAPESEPLNRGLSPLTTELFSAGFGDVFPAREYLPLMSNQKLRPNFGLNVFLVEKAGPLKAWT